MKRHKTLLCMGTIGLALTVLAPVLWRRVFHQLPPKEIMQDVRAGLAARHVQDPKARVETFLEARYGPLSEPANRQKAFLDFFNVDHIKGLNFIVNHTPAAQKQVNTEAMAQWIAHYRASMTAAERTALQARLNTEAGRTMLRQATVQYESQDVYFRGAQKPVIAELMATLAALRKP